MGTGRAEADPATFYFGGLSWHSVRQIYSSSSKVCPFHRRQRAGGCVEIEVGPGDNRTSAGQDCGLLAQPDSEIAILRCRWRCGVVSCSSRGIRSQALRGRSVRPDQGDLGACRWSALDLHESVGLTQGSPCLEIVAIRIGCDNIQNL